MELQPGQGWSSGMLQVGSNELQVELGVGQRWSSNELQVELKVEQRWTAGGAEGEAAVGQQ